MYEASDSLFALNYLFYHPGFLPFNRYIPITVDVGVLFFTINVAGRRKCDGAARHRCRSGAATQADAIKIYSQQFEACSKRDMSSIAIKSNSRSDCECGLTIHRMGGQAVGNPPGMQAGTVYLLLRDW